MAAPSNAYRSKSLWARNKANTANIEHLNAIIHMDEATMLSRFYLDDMAVMRLPDGTDGAVGIVNIGSANYEMHNVARHGSMRDGNRVWLNDGGLNTKGIVMTNYSLVLGRNYSNLLIFQLATFKSAFYVDTISYGFEFRKSGGSWVSYTLPSSNIGQQVTVSGVTRAPLSPKLQEFTSYEVRGFLVNAEGKYEMPVTGFITTGDYLEQVAFFKRSSPCSSTGQVMITAYQEALKNAQMSLLNTTPTARDLIAFKDNTSFEELDTGWYSEGQENSFYYLKGSGFTHLEECAPSTPTISITVTMSGGVYTSVVATRVGTDTASVTINGRIDDNPDTSTGAGISWSITMGSGATTASDPIYLVPVSGKSYYIRDVGSTPNRLFLYNNPIAEET